MMIFAKLPEGCNWVFFKKENILVIDLKYRPENRCPNPAANALKKGVPVGHEKRDQ